MREKRRSSSDIPCAGVAARAGLEVRGAGLEVRGGGAGAGAGGEGTSSETEKFEYVESRELSRGELPGEVWGEEEGEEEPFVSSVSVECTTGGRFKLTE